MKLYNIVEARRNPDNPAQQKEDAYEQVKKYSNDDSIFISYTSIDKLGINPSSRYNTPIGIYTYPLKTVFQKYIEPTKDVKKVPFAGNQPFIQVAKLDKNVKTMSIDTYTENDFNQDIEKLYKWVEEKNIRLFTPRNDFDYYVNEYSNQARNQSPAGKIWNITRLIADYYAKNNKKNPPVVWTHILFRVLGYYGVIDLGNSIIHPSEPEQAVFFNVGALTIIDKVENKRKKGLSILFSEDYFDYDDIEQYWLRLKNLDEKNLEKFMKYAITHELTRKGISNLPYRFLDTDKVSPEVEKNFIKNNTHFLKFIKNPKEETLRWVASERKLLDNNTPFAELYSEEYWKDLGLYTLTALMFIKNPSLEFVDKIIQKQNESLKLYAFLDKKITGRLEFIQNDIKVLKFLTEPTKEQLDYVIEIFKQSVITDDGIKQSETFDVIKTHYKKYDNKTLNSLFDVSYGQYKEYSFYQKSLFVFFVKNKIKISEKVINSFVEQDGNYVETLHELGFKITEELALTALFTSNEPNRFAIKYINNKTLEVQKRFYDLLPTYDKRNFFVFIEKPDPNSIIYIMKNLPNAYNVGSIIETIIKNYSDIVPINIGIKQMFNFDALYASKFSIKNSIILNDSDIIDIINNLKLNNKQNAADDFLRYVSILHQEYIPDDIALAFYDFSPNTFIGYYIDNKINLTKKTINILLKKDNNLKYILDITRSKKAVVDVVAALIFNLKKNNVKSLTFNQIGDLITQNKKYIESQDKYINDKNMLLFRDLLLSELIENGIDIVDENTSPENKSNPNDMQIGNLVKIIKGPFEGFNGKISAINGEKYIVKIDIFGKPTPANVEKSDFVKL